MTFQVHEAEQLSIEQMREFLQGSRQLTFARQGRAAVYQFLERVLQARRYDRCTRAEKGVVRAYLAKLTGLSRAQITRLIGRWSQTREVRRCRHAGRASRAVTAPPTSPCWRRSTPHMRT